MRLYEFNVVEGKHDPHIFKAIFLAGGPGSGKSYVGKKIIGGSGLRVVNSDHFFEMLAKRAGRDLDTQTSEDFHKSTDLAGSRLDILINGHVGVLLDGTGRDYNKIMKTKERLEDLRYETMMILVNTNLETAIRRNNARERKVSMEFLTQTHNETRDNIGKFQSLFGDNFIIVDNSNDTGTDFDVLWKKIRSWLDRPVT